MTKKHHSETQNPIVHVDFGYQKRSQMTITGRYSRCYAPIFVIPRARHKEWRGRFQWAIQKNAYCGRHVSAAVDFRLRAQVRSPRFGPRSRCQELNPGPSYRRNRSRGVRPLGQAGPAGSGWRTLGRENATAALK